ncbi:MAG: carbohydrate-binding domain-containing protein [Prevotella sp.]|nr:carbohydrate-binding domain-containing protein [Prevotella sp.]
MKRMKTMTIMLMAAMTMMTMTMACSSDDPLSNDNPNNGNDNLSDEGGEETITSTYADITTFSVAIDKATAEPATAASATYPEASDDISKNTFETIVNIDMANPIASTENGVTITVDGSDVTADHGKTEGVCYVVSGTTTDGSLTIEGKTDYELNLKDADITNTRSTAIDLQSKMKAFIVLTGDNKLTDGITADDSHKGAIFGKGKMLFSGTGSLEVYGNYNNGIHGKSNIVFDKGVNIYVKSTANHGIKSGDDLYINGGILNVEVSAAGAKGINSDIDVTINGGRTTVISTSNGKWDTDDLETKASAGIACDSILTINGGEIYLQSSGSGGKGLKADWEAYINGGKIRIITTGGLYYSNGTTENHNYTGNTDNLADEYTSSPKGIKIGTKNEHGVLTIKGGDIMVRTSGNNAEGIESKGTLDITDGTILVYAYDDAINSSGDLTISGGTVVVVGTNNDGIDSNGDMYLKGGTLIAVGAGGAEAGIDINEQKKLYISGGNIFGIGGRFDGSLGSTSQGIISTTGSITANGTVTVSSDGKTLVTFNMPPVSYNSGTMMVSTPNLTSGNSYTLVAGNKSQTVTASNTISGGMGGPGGGPGGPGGPGGW